jgi:hypothetical protein
MTQRSRFKEREHAGKSMRKEGAVEDDGEVASAVFGRLHPKLRVT